MENFWNERYRESGFAYGAEPNQFFAESIENLSPGKMLLPCEGEGRNAVYAASKGWNCIAFDASLEGRNKAIALAADKKVDFTYEIANADSITFAPNSFDAIALIYAHFPSSIRKDVHRKMADWLRPGGILILEAFNPKQSGNSSGGPKDPTMLYTEEMLHEDFSSLLPLQINSARITLNEGKYHIGPADVVRFVAIKPAE